MRLLLNTPEVCKTLVRQIGRGWRIRVHGADETRWLRDQLRNAGFECSSVSDLLGTPMFLFTCRPGDGQESASVVDQIRMLPSVSLEIAPT